jgi:hypothetical protein
MDDDEPSNASTSQLKETVNDEEKRKILRIIEVKTLKFIDDLETGKIKRDTNSSIQEQTEIYRSQLMKELMENKSQFLNEPEPKKVQKSRSTSSSSTSSSDSDRGGDRKRRKSNSPRAKGGNSSSSHLHHGYSRKKYK